MLRYRRDDGPQWSDAEQEELSRIAAKFKADGDLAGVHLCAVVEEEMRRCDATGSCKCAGTFYLALVMSRASYGADHELAHALLPQVQQLIRRAQHEKRLDDLKREAGIED